MTHIMDDLQADHRNLSVLLDILEQEINIYDSGNTPDFETLTCILEYCVDYPDHYHHPKEEVVARRLIDQYPSHAATLDSLSAEHAEIAALTTQFADQVSQAIAEPGSLNKSVVEYGQKFMAIYRAHMENEETVLFAPAKETLTDDDWNSIDAACAQRADPLFDDHIQDAYRALHQRIVRRAQQA